MKSKVLLFIGIILLVVGIILKKTTQMDTLGLVSIITGVSFKIIYILKKIKNNEYSPGKELFFLVSGLILFLTGLYLRGINQTLIKPIYLIVFGIIFKTIFIIRFIQILRSEKKRTSTPNQIKKPLSRNMGV